MGDGPEDMPVKDGAKKSLIGVIDDGTKTVRFVVYEAERSEELAAFQLDKSEIQPQEGWSEQDPLEILHHITKCAESTLNQLVELGYSTEDVITLGVTNQRETTIAWDKNTGKPLHPAISWNDIRTDSTVDAILAKIPDRNKNYLKVISGLPISPYSSAVKMRWLYENVKSVRRAARERRLLFGTVDSWIIWNLTGGPNGGLHVTDVTNASRTLLMNLETLNWDPMLCRLFGVHRDTLPQIRSSSEVYGVVKDGSVLDGIRISGILGNQQSALVGQNCLKAGQAKNTYRSGCFLLYNTGEKRVQSTHGLITTVAYKMGPHAPPVYALEGSIAVAGGAMKFLRDNLKFIKDVASDTEHLGGQVFSTGDVYFVPAFSGLYAPYWRKDARGIICGLTAFTTKHHIIRAALEAVCFQTRDIIEAMNQDCGMPLSKLHVDGKMTSNDLLMQLQADLIGIPVMRAHSWDMAALGVAIAAGNSVGVWSVDEWQHHATGNDTFLPTTKDDDRDARYTKWKMAVQRSLGWATIKKSIAMTGQNRKHTMLHESCDRIPSTDDPLAKDQLSSLDSRTTSLDTRRMSVDTRRTSVDTRRPSVDSRRLSWDSRSLDRSYPNLESSSALRDYLNSSTDTINSRDIDFAVTSVPSDDGVKIRNNELQQYSPKKISDSAVLETERERTILDDAEFFNRKQECDYWSSNCDDATKTAIDWREIETMIENDPEIIFDSQDNPILVSPLRKTTSMIDLVLNSQMDAVDSELSLKRRRLKKLPVLLSSMCSKFSGSSFI